jgi:hypothetical protein
VYFAEIQAEAVVMDLVRDRYWGFDQRAALIWRMAYPYLATGALAFDVVEAGRAAGVQLSDRMICGYLDAWRRVGLLTDAATSAQAMRGLPVPHPSAPPAEISFDSRLVSGAPFSLLEHLRLFRAKLTTAAWLKNRGLASTLAGLQSLRSRTGAAPRTHSSVAIAAILRAYQQSRTLVEQGRNDCLTRSIALLYVLRRTGIAADICFGVTKFPFAAHAWVECERQVLNDSASMVARFAILCRF